MNERRVKEVCRFCGGDKLTMREDDKIKIICLICGKDFEACRESDFHRFHKTETNWYGA